MIALVQRVNHSSVKVDSIKISEIGRGLLVFIGIEQGDTDKDAAYISRKVVNLRCFDDQEGRMNLSVREVGGEILAVSQFTLAADTRRGNRPGFSNAEEPEKAKIIFDNLIKFISSEGITVRTGVFGAHMHVELENDGPVTFIIDSRRRF